MPARLSFGDEEDGIPSEGLGRVLVATLRVSEKCSDCQRDQILVPQVRRLLGNRSAP